MAVVLLLPLLPVLLRLLCYPPSPFYRYILREYPERLCLLLMLLPVALALGQVRSLSHLARGRCLEEVALAGVTPALWVDSVALRAGVGVARLSWLPWLVYFLGGSPGAGELSLPVLQVVLAVALTYVVQGMIYSQAWVEVLGALLLTVLCLRHWASAAVVVLLVGGARGAAVQAMRAGFRPCARSRLGSALPALVLLTGGCLAPGGGLDMGSRLAPAFDGAVVAALALVVRRAGRRGYAALSHVRLAGALEAITLTRLSAWDWVKRTLASGGRPWGGVGPRIWPELLAASLVLLGMGWSVPTAFLGFRSVNAWHSFYCCGLSKPDFLPALGLGVACLLVAALWLAALSGTLLGLWLACADRPAGAMAVLWLVVTLSLETVVSARIPALKAADHMGQSHFERALCWGNLHTPLLYLLLGLLAALVLGAVLPACLERQGFTPRRERGRSSTAPGERLRRGLPFVGVAAASAACQTYFLFQESSALMVDWWSEPHLPQATFVGLLGGFLLWLPLSMRSSRLPGWLWVPLAWMVGQASLYGNGDLLERVLRSARLG